MRRHVLIFFDDILVYSKDWDSHLLHLEQVLITLQEHKLYVNILNVVLFYFKLNTWVM